jgi:hypothetical protein
MSPVKASEFWGGMRSRNLVRRLRSADHSLSVMTVMSVRRGVQGGGSRARMVCGIRGGFGGNRTRTGEFKGRSRVLGTETL